MLAQVIKHLGIFNSIGIVTRPLNAAAIKFTE